MAEKVEELLAQARAVLPHRLSPAEALEAQGQGALLIDIRGDDQRRAGGLIPGAAVVPRNVLEWRCDPASPWRHAAIRGWDQVVVLVCQEGFQSSLAAATLQRLGLRNATDLDGGRLACRWCPPAWCRPDYPPHGVVGRLSGCGPRLEARLYGCPRADVRVGPAVAGTHGGRATGLEP